ncbi:MAG: DUF4367 domain-containing protein [Blautia sp.]|nr:DUF4367 domain-containing protein [Blautia sp.]
MDKIAEQKNRRRTLSAQDQYDENFNGGYSPEELEEAALIEREIQNIPDMPEWEPTEEKFQALMAKARERGLFTEGEHSEVKENEKTDALENTNENEQNPKEKSNRKQKICSMKKKVIKWSAVAAATIIGIFTVSMSSEANRAYIMQEVNRLFGNDVNTELDNVEVKETGRTEEYAFQDIANTFNIKMPEFFYMPEDMKYLDYTLDESAQTAIVRYSYDKQMIYLAVFINNKEITRLTQEDSGSYLCDINSHWVEELHMALWEVYEEGDEQPTYSLKWNYKNVYYEFLGKLGKEEMENIAKEIMY